MTGPEVVDLFAGPGGWDEGARLLGFDDQVLGIENEPNACATAEAAGHARLNADIAAIDPHDVAQVGIAGLIGSPPCPGFSPAGKGLGRKDLEMLTQAIKRLAYGDDPAAVLTDVRAAQHDERSALTLEPLRWILALQPEWIALEQVPQVLPLWHAYADALRPMGYNVHAAYMHAEQYGVAQTRKRAVFGASRVREVGQPTPTHRWPKTLAAALGWESALTLHHIRGAGMRARHGERPGRTASQPSFTVTGKARSWEVEDTRNGHRRRFTIEEASRVQTFPGNYPWHGSRSCQFQQVGNALPPLMAARRLAGLTS